MLQLIEHRFSNLILEIDTFHARSLSMLLVDLGCKELLEHSYHFLVACKSSDIDRHRASSRLCLISSIYQQEPTKLCIIIPGSPVQRSEENDLSNDIYSSSFFDEQLYDLKTFSFHAFRF